MIKNTAKMMRGQDAIEAAKEYGVQLYKLDADARWVKVESAIGPVAPYGVRTSEVMEKMVAEAFGKVA